MNSLHGIGHTRTICREAGIHVILAVSAFGEAITLEILFQSLTLIFAPHVVVLCPQVRLGEDKSLLDHVIVDAIGHKIHVVAMRQLMQKHTIEELVIVFEDVLGLL